MAGITATGIGSGLDVEGLVSQLVAAERQPALNRINTREARLQTELSAIGSFKSALSELNDAARGLSGSTAFTALKATAGNSDLLGVSASGAAQPGSYSVKVMSLAQSHKLATSEANRFDSVTDAVGTGTLTLEFGAYEGDALSGAFTANDQRSPVSINIDAGNNTLAGIRDAINEADAGVRASIINDGEGYRLTLSSTQSGADNALKIGTSGGDGGLAVLGTDQMIQTVAAKDALVEVDGLQISSDSNTLSDVIPGVTLDLKSADPEEATTVTVSRDTNSAAGAVSAFVEAYNKFVNTADKLTRYNPDTGEKGALLGDGVVRSAVAQVRNLFNLPMAGTGELRGLSDVGISLQRDGELRLDNQKLNEAVAENPDAVAALFTRGGSATDSLIDYVGAEDSSRAGTYAVNIDQLATQGSFQAAALADATVTADNDTFSLKVDGIQSGTITLTAGSYTGADLAAHIQNRINADSALADAGVMVGVEYDADNNRLMFTSGAYGENSTVEFTQVDSQSAATLGLSVGAGSAGQSVAGSIGGVTAQGDGQRLTGSGSAAGIEIDVLGGATGNRGTVSLSQGFGGRLESLLDGLLEDGGLLQSRSDSIGSRIDRLDEQRERIDERSVKLQDRYFRQFNRLDAVLGELQNTGNFLVAQLSLLAVPNR